jgi:hypothetical protein
MTNKGKLSTHLCECNCGKVTPIATRNDVRRHQVKGQPVRFLPGHNCGPKRLREELVRQQDEITVELLEEMRSWDDRRVANRLDGRMRSLERWHKSTFVEIGLICLEMSERKLWTKLADPATGVVYTSFDGWLKLAAPVSQSTGYAAMTALKKLNGVVSTADLLQMPRGNVMTVSKLSKKTRASTVTVNGHAVPIVEAAKSLTEGQLLDRLDAEYPNEHLEPAKKVIARPTRSQRSVIDQAIEIAMALEECRTREEALEAIAVAYIQDNLVRYDQLMDPQNRLRERAQRAEDASVASVPCQDMAESPAASGEAAGAN